MQEISRNTPFLAYTAESQPNNIFDMNGAREVVDRTQTSTYWFGCFDCKQVSSLSDSSLVVKKDLSASFTSSPTTRTVPSRAELQALQ